MKWTIQGDKELIRKLQGLKKTKLKAALRKASRAGCKIVQPVAKSMAPVRTGKMASVVKVRALKRSKKWTGCNVRVQGGDDGAFYSGFVMLGTKYIKHPNDFLKRAGEQCQGQATDVFIAVLKAEVETALKG